MTTPPECHLKTGGDPRTLADYARLRDEMNKLTHPARPDVNWQHAETLCLSLFEHNGVELQTAAWYTLARTHQAGLNGLNEGLTILVALVSRQWGNVWPQQTAVRMKILSSLSKRLQLAMRTLPLTSIDLRQLYQAEAHLAALDDVLQRLELKHVSQLDALYTLMHNTAVRLEDSENKEETALQTGAAMPEPSCASLPEPTVQMKWVYVAEPAPRPEADAVTAFPPSAKPWKPFAAGMLTMLALAGAAAGGWLAMRPSETALRQFTAMLTPLPAALSAEQLRSLRQHTPTPETGIKQTQQRLAQLLQLKPDWALDYGDHLAQQALTLWPEQAKPLARQWQQQVSAAALPAENLNGWHQGMTQLQQLTNRLNALDEQKGRYITVSELKSAVFAITQSFSRAVPAEEQLRQLSEQPHNQPGTSAQQSQTEQHLQQLIARYAALKQKTAE